MSLIRPFGPTLADAGLPRVGDSGFLGLRVTSESWAPTRLLEFPARATGLSVVQNLETSKVYLPTLRGFGPIVRLPRESVS